MRLPWCEDGLGGKRDVSGKLTDLYDGEWDGQGFGVPEVDMEVEEAEGDKIDNDAARSADDSHLKDRRGRPKIGGKDTDFCPKLAGNDV